MFALHCSLYDPFMLSVTQFSIELCVVIENTIHDFFCFSKSECFFSLALHVLDFHRTVHTHALASLCTSGIARM